MKQLQTNSLKKGDSYFSTSKVLKISIYTFLLLFGTNLSANSYFSKIYAKFKSEINVNTLVMMCSGNADAVTISTGVGVANEALGAPNNVGAQLHDTGDQLGLDLTDIIKAGETYTIRWQRRNGTSANPVFTIEESLDGTTWITAAGSPFTESVTTWSNNDIVASTNFRYLRITTTNVYDLQVDAVTYNNITCCTAFPSYTTLNFTQGTCNGSSPNNDAAITVNGIADGDRADISTASASTYDGNDYANAATVSGGTITFSGLAQQKNYIIRIYDGADGCPTDISTTTSSPPSQCQSIPADVPWDGIDCNGRPIILQNGIAAITCGVTGNVPVAERWAFALMDLDGVVPASGRTEISGSVGVYHHDSWHIDEIGNVYGTAINNNEGSILLTASTNFAAGFTGQTGIVRYGGLAGGTASGDDDFAAGGAIYKLDPTTGEATVFTLLPQQAANFTHDACEGGGTNSRTNSGVGLGNIVFDMYHNQYFVTNFEDGRIYRLDVDGNILDTYDPFNDDNGAAGISDIQDLVYGLAIEPGGGRLFFGGIDTPGGTGATAGDPAIHSIDLSTTGGFVGTNTATGLGYDNYTGTETFHTTIATGVGTEGFLPNNYVYSISDLAFNSSGDLIAGIRVGCNNSIMTSYNHFAETNIITPTGSTYNNVTQLDISISGDAGPEDGYGGVATYVDNNGNDIIGVSSADILAEIGPHGIAVFNDPPPSGSIDPLAAASYGVDVSGDPKGVGGEIEFFGRCIPPCEITGTDVTCASTTGLVYSAPSGADSYSWSITSGNATINGASNNQTVTVDAGTNNFTLSLEIIPAAPTTCEYNVTVNPLPTCTVSNNGPICNGETLTLNETGGNATMWSWSSNGGATISNTSAQNPTATGVTNGEIFTVVITDNNGCTSSCTTTATVNPLPTCTVSNNGPICNGETLTLNETGGNATMWAWSSNGSAIISNTSAQSPTATGVTDGEIFTVVVTDNNGCTSSCTTTATVNPLPTITIDDVSCNFPLPTANSYDVDLTTNGNTVTSTAGTVTDNGGGSFTISNIPTNTDITITSTITSTGCQQTQAVTAPNCNCPNINPPTSGGDQTICNGDAIPTLTVTVNPGETADWYDSQSGGTVLAGGGGQLGYTPSGAGTFYAEARNIATGCTSNTRTAVTLTINPTPTCSASNNGPICQGQTLSLDENGGDATMWAWSSNGSAVFNDASAKSPMVTGAVDNEIFTVIVTDANGCTSSCSTTATVNPLPVCTASNDGPICVGETLTLNETGGDATSWMWSTNGSASISNMMAQNPTATGVANGEIFTVIVTDANGCTSTCNTTAIVNSLPTCNATNNGPICQGQTLSLNETGGDATMWAWSTNGSGTFSNNSIQNPTVTGVSNGEVFTVIITDANGCTSTCNTTATVNPLPTCNITGPNSVVENTQDETYSGPIGMASYFWSITAGDAVIDGANNGQSVQIDFGTASSVIELTIVDGNGCTSTCITSVNMTTSLSCSITGPTVACATTTGLTFTGTADATTYTWTITAGDATINGANNTQDITVDAGNNNFTIELTIDPGAPATCSQMVTINPLPTCIASNNGPICIGETLNLSETGGDATSWMWTTNGSGSISDATVSNPTVTGATNGEIFTVIITDANGCTSSCNTTAVVNPLPTCNATNNGPICQGQTLTLNENGGNATMWAWSSNGTATFNDATAQSPTATGVTNGEIFTVMITDANGCTSSCMTTATVNPLPTCNATNSGPICIGEDLNLNENGGDATMWAWSSNGTATFNNSTVQNPIAIGVINGEIFTVIITDTNGCTSTCTTTATVNSLPACSASNNGPVCTNETLSLNETGGDATMWAWSTNGSGIINGPATQNPTVTGMIDGEIFTVIVTDANGCTSSCSTTATVNPLPTCSASNNGPICAGEDLILNETGGDATDWSWTTNGTATFNGISGNLLQNPTVSGARNGDIFTVVITDANGCTSTCSTTAVVNDLPICNATNNGPICNGETLTLNENGGNAIAWAWSTNGGAVLSNSMVQNPTAINVSNGEIFTVVITDANGCTSSCSTSAIVNNLPNCNASNDGPVCNGEPLTLNETGGNASMWAWSTNGSGTFNNSSAQSPTVTGMTNGEVFTVIITDANGCTSSCSTTAVVNPLPNCNATNNGPICAGEDLLLNETGGDATMWAWSTNGTATFDDPTVQNPTITGAVNGEIFTVITTDASGCTSTCSTTAIVNDLPTCNATNDGPICNGESLNLNENGGNAVMWAWSTNGGALLSNSMVQSPTATNVSNGEVFTVIITDTNGCTSTCSTTATVNTLPTCNATNSGPICNGETLTLNENGGNAVMWAWSTNGSGTFNNASAQNPTVTGMTNGEIFTVIVTDTNGCTSTCSTTAIINSPPTCNATNDGPICNGETLNLNENGGNATMWAWSTNGAATFSDATAQNPTVTGAANGEIFTVLITDANGCTSSCSTTATVNTLPTCNATNSGPICNGETLTLNENGGNAVMWAWSTNGSAVLSNSMVQNPTATNVSNNEVFTVIITNANGCTSTCNTIAVVNSNPIAVTSNNSPLCEGSTLNLTENSGLAVSWLWTSNGSATITNPNDQNPTASNVVNGEIFTVVITDANGCTGSSTTTAIINPLPVCDISGSTNVLENTQDVVYTGTAGMTVYAWSVISGDAVIDGVNNAQNVTLDFGSMNSVLELSITDANGCMSTCNISIDITPTLACTINGPTEICYQTTNLSYSGPAGATSYNWTITSGDATITSTTNTQTVTVDAGDNDFTIELTLSPGAPATCNQIVTVNPAPTCNATNNGPICQGQDLNLNETGGNATMWAWSTNGTATFNNTTIQNPTVSNATNGEIFTVIITDANGCTSSCSTTAVVNALPTCNATNDGPICNGESLNLNENGGNATMWVWSSDGTATFNDASAQNPVVTGATNGEVFTVIITDANGCTSSCSTTAVVNATPNCNATNDSPICNGESLNLNENGGNATMWAWSTNGTATFNDASAQNPVVTGATNGEVFTVIITDANGCTSFCSTTAVVNPAPNCNATNDGPICNGESLNLSENGGNATMWAWSTNGTATFNNTTIQNPIVSNATNGEIFTVIITDANGCTSSCSTTAVVNATPNCNATNDSPICNGESLNLNENGGNATMWAWSTNGTATFNDASAQNPVVTGAANGEVFTVIITDANGCTSSCSTTAVVNATPNCNATNDGPICNGESLNLNENGGNATMWAWSTNGTATFNNTTIQNPVVTGAANGEVFTVIITDANGCTSSCSTIAVVNALPNCNATNDGPICNGESLNLNENGGNATMWAWSSDGTATFNNTTIQNPIVSNATNGEVFTVIITDANGCTSSCSTTAVVNATPNCNATNDGPICNGESLNLNENGGNATMWAWSTNGTATFNNTTIQNPIVSNATNGEIFTVIITDANGCTSSCSTTVVVNATPTCNATNNGPICNGESLNLNENGGNATMWAWSTDGTATFNDASAQNPVVTGAANGEVFTVIITDANGCTSSCSTTAVVNATPNCNATNDGPVCNGESLNLNENGGNATMWAWSTNGTATFNNTTIQNPSVSNATNGEIFTVIITDANGCTSSCSTTAVVNALPACNATNNGPICQGQDLNLNETGGNATMWTWSTNGAATFNDSSAQNPVVTGVANGEIFTVIITDANGCTSSCSTTAVVNTLPVCDIAGSTSVLQNTQDVVYTGTAGMAIYAWSVVSGDAVIDGPNNTQNVTLDFGSMNSVLELSITDANGCMSTCNISIDVTPTIACTINGPTEACYQTNNLSYSGPAGASSYSWAITNGDATITSATNTQTVTVDAGNNNFTIELTLNSGASTCNQIVTINPAPNCNATNDGPICNGESLNLNENGGNATMWAWSTNGTATFNNTTIQNPSVSNATNGEIFTVIITDANGCTSSCSTTAVVNALPACNATNNSPICQGQDLNLNETGGNATMWTWSTNGAATFNDSSAQNPVVTGAANGEIFTVIITDANGCTSSCSTTAVVNTLPVCDIAGSTSVLQNTQDVVYTGTAGMAIYAWSVVSGDAVIDGPNNTQNVTLDFGSMNSVLELSITDANGCMSTCNISIDVTPTIACTINGPTEACYQTTNLSYSGPAGASSYSWAITTGDATITSATNTQTVTVDAGNNNFTIELTLNPGASTCNQIVTINPAPSCNATNDSPICDGETLNLNEIGGNATMWAWSTNGTATFNDASAQNPAVTGAVNGEIFTVIITDANGCTATCATTAVVNPLPVCNISGTASVITNTQDHVYSAPAGMASYNWSISGNGTIDGATNAQNVTVDAGGIGSFELTLTIIDGNGCTSTCMQTVNVTSSTVADLSLSKTVDNSVAQVGDTVTFTIVVANDGPSPGTGIEVTDQLPTGFTFIDDDAMGAYVGNIWTVGNLAVGEMDTLNIRAEVLATGIYQNDAEITAANEADVDSDPNADNMTDDFGDGNPDDDEDSATVTPNLIFDLSLDKHLANGQPTTVTLGDDVEYTIVVTNEGDITANMVQICDLIPDGLALSVNDNNNWSGTSPDTLYNTLMNPIPPGASDSVNIILRVVYGQSGGTLTNVAEIFNDADSDGNGVIDNDSSPGNGNGNEDDIEEESIQLLDYDPTGYIYCDKTGKVVTGGTISVTGPSGIPNDPNEIAIIEDGSGGYYAWYAVGPAGVYSMTYNHPEGHLLSTSKTPTAALYDVPPGPPNITLGSDTTNMYLTDTTFANNPYYLNFDIEDGDAFVFQNNLPVGCVLISSIVCEDVNQNDMDDGNEPGLENVVVRLYDCADLTTPLDTTLTDANGRYTFDGLQDGNYQVQFVTPNGFRLIQPNADTIGANGFTSCTMLSFGECDTTKMVCFIGTSYDYGDLPDGTAGVGVVDYQTTIANNGPAHQIIDGLMIGATVDREDDGQQSGNALGDGPDEDGFSFPATMNIAPGVTLTLPLDVTNTTGTVAHFEAWIDWNGDGDFDDANEMIANLSDDGLGDFGQTSLSVLVPSDAVQTQLLGVRFRLSHTDNMTPLGQVESGEVEDYLISVSCPPEQCLSPTIQINRE